MDNEIEFLETKEEKSFLQPLPDTKIPKKSIEGWIYEKIPGNIATKRYILICLILFIFILSAVFLLLAHSNSSGI